PPHHPPPPAPPAPPPPPGVWRGPPGRGGPPGGASAAVTVVTGMVGSAARIDRISAIGTGEALRTVVLAPEAAGRVVEMFVSPGAQVEAGERILRLDSAAEEIARDRAELMLEEARATEARFERLRATGTATEVQIRDAALAVRNAELTLRQAELDLSRRQVVAPIDGWIGLLDVETGAQISAGTRIGRIDDRSVLLVDFRLPERLVGRIAPGDTLRLTALARSETVIEGRIRAIDSRVDETARNLRVQAEIANDDDDLRAGMAFAIEMRFTGEEMPSVDPLAIQWGAEGAYVWVVREGRVARVPVRIIQRAGGAVLVSGSIEPGEVVVLEGVQNLRPGTEVAPRDTGTGDTGAGATGAAGSRPAGGEGRAGNGGERDADADAGDETGTAGEATQARARPAASEG
ncbi:MAG: efflux RND transporter periplasmic adaptor subunit, partial [Pararhodobacter sp.]|nr:efflux RND transporter periplasmic adaptor subunit [Pararhodobacter sp.]